MYLRTKFQVSSIILTSFRQELILPYSPPPPPQNWPLKSPPRSRLMFCFWASFLTDLSYLAAANAKGGSFSSDWYVIFHVIWFFNTNGNVAKNNWYWKFGKFPKSVWDGVCFNKIASLCCINCSFTITRIYHNFFLE